MRVRAMLVPLAFAAACSNDTGVSNGTPQTDTQQGDGGMTVDPPELAFEDLDVGYSHSLDFTITSDGEANLQITEMRVVQNSSIFFFQEPEEYPLVFAPGQSQSFTVAATLQTDAPQEGQLQIRSNDPDETRYVLQMHAWPVGYEPPADTGDTADSGSP